MTNTENKLNSKETLCGVNMASGHDKNSQTVRPCLCELQQGNPIHNSEFVERMDADAQSTYIGASSPHYVCVVPTWKRVGDLLN